MSNVEGMYSACRELLCRTARREPLCRTARREPLCRTVYFKKQIEQSETTLRHSAVRYSIFCGSLFRSPEVSYEGSRVPRFLVTVLITLNVEP